MPDTAAPWEWKVVEPSEGERLFTDSVFSFLRASLVPRKRLGEALVGGKGGLTLLSAAGVLLCAPLSALVAVLTAVAIAILSVTAYPAALVLDLFVSGRPIWAVNVRRAGVFPFPQNSAQRRDWMGTLGLTTVVFAVTGLLTAADVGSTADLALALCLLAAVYAVNVLAYTHSCELSVEKAEAAAAAGTGRAPALQAAENQLGTVERGDLPKGYERRRLTSSDKRRVYQWRMVVALAILATGPGLVALVVIVGFIAVPALTLQKLSTRVTIRVVEFFGMGGSPYVLKVALVYANAAVFAFVAWLEFRDRGLPGFTARFGSAAGLLEGADENSAPVVLSLLFLFGGHYSMFWGAGAASLASALHLGLVAVLLLHGVDNFVTRRTVVEKLREAGLRPAKGGGDDDDGWFSH